MAADVDIVDAAWREPAADRFLIRFGVRDDVARIVAATPALTISWLLAALGAALFAAWGDEAAPVARSALLVLAPVLPVAGVAAAYGPWADPMYELTQATPSAGLRLLLLRSVTVLIAAGVLVTAASLAVPGAGIAAIAWVLPALALCSSSVMLATFIPLPRAAALVTVSWLVLLVVVGATSSTDALSRGPAQLAFFGVTVASSLVLVRRRDHLEIANLRTRRALVDAADVERGRIERNIHDGAQQQLVAIGVKANLAQAMVTKDPDRAVAILGQIGAEAREALEGLRDMTRGTCPPILADEGLPAALAAKAGRSPLPVEVRADGVSRLPTSIEVAAYFCCLEAMQNAAKYARATAVLVTLRATGSELTFAVHDDGAGFDPTTARRGVGMRSMADRVEVLGGELDVRSAPGRGTSITGRLPFSSDAVAADP